MASNISQSSKPYYWVSANDDVTYKFAFNPHLILNVIDDGGRAQVTLSFNMFDVLPIPGEYIYLNTNVYVGTYKIYSVAGTFTVTLDTTYISDVTNSTYNCYQLRLPLFNVYKGIGDFSTELPYTFVVPLKPSIKYDLLGVPYIEINLKGITKHLFEIVPNTVPNGIDFSMFNGVRIEWDTETSDTVNVLNCAITNDDLVLNYIGGGVYLTPSDKPFVPTSGVCFASIFEGFGAMYPTIHKFINGVKI